MNAERKWQIEVTLDEVTQVEWGEKVPLFLERCLGELRDIAIPKELSHLSVLLTRDESIRQMNRSYRGKDRPTDVLSFPQQENIRKGRFSEMAFEGVSGEGEPFLSLGDIVISVDTAIQQAEQAGRPLSEEIAQLLVHGLLHLYGYDHEGVPEQEAEEMFRRQDEISSRHHTLLTP
ncbi:rRNA maturation RNase YbeY [bacterium]|nr:rRNA maturation RNase YbeY [bacterium]